HDEVRAEEENYRELLQSVKADFINYKRRVQQDGEDQAKSANKELILKLLPTIDDLERALSSGPQEIADAEWVEGVALIHRKLEATLEGEGLERIDAEGKEFDPWEHEAVFCEESSDHDEGKVKTVLRNGYKLHDKVIRPAQVVVSKGRD
ncbi:MAG: nucleotide exchange factor GrpE, partial [Dehalococcoidia bacterium]